MEFGKPFGSWNLMDYFENNKDKIIIIIKKIIIIIKSEINLI